MRSKVLAGVVGAYAILWGWVLAGCGDRLLLYPSRHSIDSTALERREVHVEGQGPVEVWIARSAGASRAGAKPKAYVLSFTGNAARAELTAPFFAKDWGERPVEVWAMNYPGYGGSPGSARLTTIPPATLAVFDDLRRHAGEAPIMIECRSIGTASALYVASRRTVASVILHNPPALRQMILGHHGWWNLWLLAGPVAMRVPPELDSVSHARKATVPAVFLLATEDEVVPPKYQRMVADAYAGEKRIIHLRGAKHVDRAEGEALREYEEAMDWLWEEVRADR